MKIRIHIECSNNGPEPSEELPWNFDVAGFCLYGAHNEGVFPSIPSGGSVDSESFFVLGFGPAELTATCGEATDTVSCFLIGPFVTGITDTP